MQLETHILHGTISIFIYRNLQAAICSYFDVGSSTKLPSMCLISDPTASDHETVEPGTRYLNMCDTKTSCYQPLCHDRFEKVWHIENFGAEPWPANCYLQCAQGPSMECGRKDLPPLEAGSNTYLTVHLVSPTSPGVYQSKWRLCTPGGTYFGGQFMFITKISVPVYRNVKLYYLVLILY